MVDAPTPVETPERALADGGSGAPATGFPPVTVCMVAHNPGAWFDEVLRSLLAQDYPSLDVVVVDAASDIAVAPRVHSVIPEATVVPLIANQGFAKNANTILDHPDLGPYLLLCHDDVALAPDGVRRLVEEAVRSNAGVVGPKLLDWDDPNRILHVGLAADKTGLVADLAEPGEYDQEQHDAVRDVFAVPGAVTLIRTDLFVALQGFDEAILVRGEDLDLCWRAHALGARVLVNPAATARHREDLNSRIVGHDRDRFERRHRIRAMLSNYGFAHTVRVVPQAMAASLVNVVLALLQGSVSTVVDIFAAWTWNFGRLGSIRRRRKHLASIRQVSDAEVRRLQQPGFQGLQAWQRRRADARADQRTGPSFEPSVPTLLDRRRWVQAMLLVWIGVVAVLVFGSRGLITGGVPVFNEFAAFPDGPLPLMNEWRSTWRSSGIGAEAPSSLLHFLLGFAGIASFGQLGFVRLLVTVGMLGVGTVGAYRLLRPFGSLPAQVVALVVYVAAPLPYNALFAGSWSGLVAYGAMPWIAKRLAMAAALAPFGDPEAGLRRRAADCGTVSLIVAAAALVNPIIAGSLVVFLVGWILGSLVTRRIDGVLRLLSVVLATLLGAVALLLPGSLEFFGSDTTWSAFGGTRATTGGDLSLGELFRLATGPHGNSALGWVLLIVPALSLTLALGHRLTWAARSWIVAVLSVGLAWWSERQGVPVALGDPHVLLAPAALSLAFAAGMTAVAFERDVRRYRFGWRQLVPVVAALALLVSAVAGLGGSLDGRWEVVDDGYEDVFDFLDEKAPAHARALWLGHADVLPVRGWAYDDELTYAVTHARTPTVLDHAVGNADERVREMREIFDETVSGASSRLGQQLAYYGVRYIIVVEANAPAPFSTITRPADAALSRRLTEQLDLVRVEVRPGAAIYENRAYVPTVSLFSSGAFAAESPGAFRLALPEVTSVRRFQGQVEPGELYVATSPVTNWSLEVNGVAQQRTSVNEWAQAFQVDQAGIATLRHQNETALALASWVQLGAWVAVSVLLILSRRRRL